MFNISLASIKYRNILSEYGGPLKYIHHYQVEIRSNEQGYEAVTMLNDELLKNYSCHYQIHGNASGTGSDKSLHLAIYRAISESLERWAFFVTSKSENASQYGFDVDPTTTGMAAFSGFYKTSPRQKAYLEAIERWTIQHWWNGSLRANHLNLPNNDGFKGIKILSPWGKIQTVILYSKNPQNDLIHYGFASEKNILKAIHKAEIELLRHKRVLESWHKEGRVPPKNIHEKRLLYFASKKGYQNFLDKISTNNLKDDSEIIKTIPNTLVDCHITGPWNKYASVWRVLFQPAFKKKHNDEHFFCF